MKNVYIVFRYTSETDFEFMGAFSTPATADAVCVDWTYAVCPAELDRALSLERVEWPGCWYPIARGANDNFPLPTSGTTEEADA